MSEHGRKQWQVDRHEEEGQRGRDGIVTSQGRAPRSCGYKSCGHC